MPKIFVTLVNGFTPETWPILAFNSLGRRKKCLDSYEDGDYVVHIGTKSKPTSPEHQGCLLGFATLTDIPVSSFDILRPEDLRHPINYNKKGNFKWPFGIKMKEACFFEGKKENLIATDYIKQPIPYRHAANEAVLLNDRKDIQEILNLISEHKRPVKLGIPQGMPELTEENIEEEALDTAYMLKSGPAPMEYTTTMKRTLKGTGFTYVMQFGNREDIWKIGMSSHPPTRLKAMNIHIPHEILKVKWKQYCWKEWETQEKAYIMEQKLLYKILAGKEINYERVLCSKEELINAWNEAIQEMHRECYFKEGSVDYSETIYP